MEVRLWASWTAPFIAVEDSRLAGFGSQVEDMRELEREEGLGGVYKRGARRGGLGHAQSLGFKREMVSALLEEGGKISDHIESNLARRLSVASNVLYCLAAAACGNVKRWRSSRASSAGSSPRTAEPSTALSFRFNSRSAHRQRRPTSGGNDRQTLLWHFGTLWSSNAIRSFPSMQKHVLSQP